MKGNRLPSAVLLTAVLLCGACNSGGDADGASPASATQPELIDYDQNEAADAMARPADVTVLDGAPDDFKQFIAGIIDALGTDPEEDCQFTIGVAKFDPSGSGFAVGHEHSCGGAVIMWAKRKGVWQTIWGGQSIPACSDMEKFSVPKSIAGDTCDDGHKAVAYGG